MNIIESTIEEAYQYYVEDRLNLIFNSGEGTSFYNALTPMIREINYKDLGFSYFDRAKIIPKDSKFEEIINNNSHSLYNNEDGEEGFQLIGDGRTHFDFMDYEGNSLLGTFIVDENNEIKCIKPCPYDRINRFCWGYAIVEKNGKYNAINHYGHLIFDEWYDYIKRDDVIKDRFIVTKKGIKKTINANFIRNNGHHTHKEHKDKAKGEYKDYKGPCIFVRKFGTKYALVYSEESIAFYLYNLEKKSYVGGKIGGAWWELAYDNDFLYDGYAQTIYYFHGNRRIDITNFYKKHLMHRYHMTRSAINIPIMSYEDFKKQYKKDPFNFLRQLESEHNEIKAEQIRNKTPNNLKELEKRIHENEEVKNKELDQCFDELKTIVDKIIKLTNGEEIPKRDIPLPLVKTVDENGNEYYEIPKEARGMLKFINFNNEKVNLKNVKVAGVDFTGCNIQNLNPQEVYDKDLRGCIFNGVGLSGKIDFIAVKVAGVDFRGNNLENFNPQEVYEKDLSGCNFEGVAIYPFKNFKGVNIKGARFGRDNNDTTLEFSPYSLKDAIYDDNTTFEGISLRIILEGLERAEQEPQIEEEHTQR